MEGIRNWVITQLVKQGIIKILSFLNPAGALLQAALAIYNAIMFFVNNWQRISDFVSSVFSSISKIAAGDTKGASSFIEKAMAQSIPIILNFIARLLNIGAIGKAIKKIIQKIRKPIDKVVNKAIGFIAKQVRKLFKAGKKGLGKVKGKVKGLFQWWKKKKKFKAKDGKTHRLFFRGKGKKAKLIVSSEEQDYKNFIKKLVISDSDPKKNEKKTAKIEALKILSTIEGLKISGKSTNSETQRNSIEFDKQLDLLAVQSSIFMESAEGEIPESTPPIYGGRSAGGFATSMKVDVLTKKGPKGTTAVSSLTNSVFNILRKRHESKGSSVRFYNHGHLLSKDLHGPGGNFKNLTPQSESGNQKFETTVERTLKGQINREEGGIYMYKVEAIYEPRSDSSLLKEQLGAKYEELKKTIDASELGEAARNNEKLKLDGELLEKKEIIDAENNVATKFIVNAKPLDHQLKEISGEKFTNYVVPNNIKRNSLKYVLPGELSEEERRKRLLSKKRKRGAETSRAKRKKRDKISREQISLVKRLLNTGKTQEQIAVEAKVSVRSVARIKKGELN
jgi:hypothetical protein